MKIVIFGASDKSSIGAYVGAKLEQAGQTVIYASRSGALGVACDITNARSVTRLLTRTKPNCIIHAAGVFMNMERLGHLRDWSRLDANILAKSVGTLTLLNWANRHLPHPIVIMLGGPEVSGESRFAGFTVGNGALWAATQFAASHTNVPVYYIEMPTVWPSTMLEAYLRPLTTKQSVKVKAASASPHAIFETIKKILKGEYRNGSRIIIGKHSHRI